MFTVDVFHTREHSGGAYRVRAVLEKSIARQCFFLTRLVNTCVQDFRLEKGWKLPREPMRFCFHAVSEVHFNNAGYFCDLRDIRLALARKRSGVWQL